MSRAHDGHTVPFILGVIPAQAGTRPGFRTAEDFALDSRLRGNDIVGWERWGE
jgi:hypothetical protein